MRPASLLASALVCATGAMVAQAQPSRFDELANAPFNESRPTRETAQLLRDELLFQRATQTYLWALPLINTLGMQVGSEKVFGKGYNVLPIFKDRLDAKTLITTPNSDVIYALLLPVQIRDCGSRPIKLERPGCSNLWAVVDYRREQ